LLPGQSEPSNALADTFQPAGQETCYDRWLGNLNHPTLWLTLSRKRVRRPAVIESGLPTALHTTITHLSPFTFHLAHFSPFTISTQIPDSPYPNSFIIICMLIPYLLAAAAIGFSAGVTPGPLQAVFLSYAIKGGWKKALPAAFAPLVTDGPVILLVLVILNNLPEIFYASCKSAGQPSSFTWPGNPSRLTVILRESRPPRTRTPGAPC
jgi:hypothetical protein